MKYKVLKEIKIGSTIVNPGSIISINESASDTGGKQEYEFIDQIKIKLFKNGKIEWGYHNMNLDAEKKFVDLYSIWAHTKYWVGNITDDGQLTKFGHLLNLDNIGELKSVKNINEIESWLSKYIIQVMKDKYNTKINMLFVIKQIMPTKVYNKFITLIKNQIVNSNVIKYKAVNDYIEHNIDEPFNFISQKKLKLMISDNMDNYFDVITKRLLSAMPHQYDDELDLLLYKLCGKYGALLSMSFDKMAQITKQLIMGAHNDIYVARSDNEYGLFPNKVIMQIGNSDAVTVNIICGVLNVILNAIVKDYYELNNRILNKNEIDDILIHYVVPSNKIQNLIKFIKQVLVEKYHEFLYKKLPNGKGIYIKFNNTNIDAEYVESNKEDIAKQIIDKVCNKFDYINDYLNIVKQAENNREWKKRIRQLSWANVRDSFKDFVKKLYKNKASDNPGHNVLIAPRAYLWDKINDQSMLFVWQLVVGPSHPFYNTPQSMNGYMDSIVDIIEIVEGHMFESTLKLIIDNFIQYIEDIGYDDFTGIKHPK